MVLAIIAGATATITGAVASYQRPSQVAAAAPTIIVILAVLAFVGILVYNMFIKAKCPEKD